MGIISRVFIDLVFVLKLFLKLFSISTKKTCKQIRENNNNKKKNTVGPKNSK